MTNEERTAALEANMDSVCKALALHERWADERRKQGRDYIDTRFAAMDTAVKLASQVSDAKFQGVNEFRGALSDAQSHFVTKAEHDFVLSAIQDLRESRAELRGKASQQSVTWAYVFAGISATIGLLGLAMTIIQMFVLER